MGLVYWAPMTDGTVKNQGIITTQAPTTENSHYSSSTTGKLGKCIKTNSSSSIDTFLIGDWVGTNSNTLAGWFYFPYNEIKAVIDANTSTNTVPTGTLFGYCSYAGIGLSWYSNKPMTTFWVMIAIRTGSSLYTAGYQLTAHDLMDKWVHLAGIWDNDNLKIRFFVNGEQVTQVNIASQEPVKQHLFINRNAIYGGNGPACCIPFYCNDLRVYKDEILSDRDIKHLAQGLTLHYPLSNRGFGGDNLLPYVSNSDYGSTAVEKTHTFTGWDKFCTINIGNNNINWNDHVGEYITYSCYMENVSQTSGTGTGIMIHVVFADGTYQQFYGGKNGAINQFLAQGESGFLHITTKVPNPATRTNPTTISYIRASIRHNTNNGNSTVKVKLNKFEFGDHPTPWIPNSSDPLYSSLQLGSTAELDCSGYQYNGIKNNVVNGTDSPVNQGCYVFNGTDSWVRCDTNAWMVQGAAEFTVNWWAYASDWTAVTNGGRMVSCTESGGFNTEGGATGYLRFPHYVYTNAEKTSRAYQYNNNGIKIADLTPGWHMFTLIYNLAGEKIYIDGTLHSSANSTSYGISFNTNARLYLGCEANSASPYAPYFNGKMSDFRFYYTELNADAIKELYMMGGGVV